MNLKQFLETYCDNGLTVMVTDDWGANDSFCYEGSVERLLTNPDIYQDELDRVVKSVDVSVDSILMILVEEANEAK